jgi:hypothetical protein
MKRLLVIIYLCLLFLNLPLITQAADLGCCEISQTGSNEEHEFKNLTKEECTAIDLKFGLKYTSFHDKEQVAPNGKGCEERIIATKAIQPNEPINFTPQVSIPDSNFIAGQPIRIQENTTSLANYIVAILKYSTGVIGIIAAIVLMTGGIIWVTAAGNQEQIGSAKKMIASSLIGMLLTFGSFMILAMVNTNLVNLKITPVRKIANTPLSKFGVGCCEKIKEVNGQFNTTTEPLDKEKCEQLEGYTTVTYKKGWVADNNKCEYPLGCCLIKNIELTLGIFGDKATNTTEAECIQQKEAAKAANKNWVFSFNNTYHAAPTNDKCIEGTPLDPNLDPPVYINP